ncbi:MAG: hypothetical protein QM820_35155 [Minicystis sp.]
MRNDAAGKPVALTNSGKDEQPSLSPDGARVVFVRVAGCDGAARRPVKEIWSLSLADRKEDLLMREQPDDQDVKKNLAWLARPELSADGKTLYFQTEGWATSRAVQALDLETRKVRFVAPGSCPIALGRGPDRGRVLVVQHRYPKDGAGSREWCGLIDAQGHELRELPQLGDRCGCAETPAERWDIRAKLGDRGP